MTLENTSKNKKLVLSLIFDAFGYLSFAFPFIDIVWAPASAYLMTKLYKGKKGKIAGVIAFIEEALPGLDIIPTFTLMWIYTHVFAKKAVKTVIEVEAD
jgi:hypothetical protein